MLQLDTQKLPIIITVCVMMEVSDKKLGEDSRALLKSNEFALKRFSMWKSMYHCNICKCWNQCSYAGYNHAKSKVYFVLSATWFLQPKYINSTPHYIIDNVIDQYHDSWCVVIYLTKFVLIHHDHHFIIIGCISYRIIFNIRYSKCDGSTLTFVDKKYLRISILNDAMKIYFNLNIWHRQSILISL